MRTVHIKLLALTLAVSMFLSGGLVYAATVIKNSESQNKTPPAFAPDQVIVAFKNFAQGEHLGPRRKSTGILHLNKVPSVQQRTGQPHYPVARKTGQVDNLFDGQHWRHQKAVEHFQGCKHGLDVAL